MKRLVWIISEGSPGHVSQSEGFVAALARQTDLDAVVIQTRPRLNGFARTLIRHFWMGRCGRALPDWMLKRRLGVEEFSNGRRPDLIVASGGKSVFAARSLAVKYRVPLVFLGERKPFPPEWFHTVITPSALETASCDLRTDVIITKVSPEIVSQAAAAWVGKPDGRLWAMLIGGKSRSHPYQDADWQQLAAGMTELARREGIRWLVTTSRRTGRETEEKLQAWLPPEILADAVWWDHAPAKKLAAYLGTAEKIWVTQDSVSMVTEATATGKPVVLVYPQELTFPATSFMPGYLENLEALGLVRRLPISQMPGFTEQVRPGAGRPVRTSAVLAEMVRQRLAWT